MRWTIDLKIIRSVELMACAHGFQPKTELASDDGDLAVLVEAYFVMHVYAFVPPQIAGEWVLDLV